MSRIIILKIIRYRLKEIHSALFSLIVGSVLISITKLRTSSDSTDIKVTMKSLYSLMPLVTLQNSQPSLVEPNKTEKLSKNSYLWRTSPNVVLYPPRGPQNSHKQRYVHKPPKWKTIWLHQEVMYSLCLEGELCFCMCHAVFVCICQNWMLFRAAHTASFSFFLFSHKLPFCLNGP